MSFRLKFTYSNGLRHQNIVKSHHCEKRAQRPKLLLLIVVNLVSVTVNRPGGNLAIKFSDDYTATMTGPETRVCEGKIGRKMF